MWTREELKQKGKAALSRNYWKAVLISLITIVLAGGFNSSAVFSTSNRQQENYTDEGIMERAAGSAVILSENEGIIDSVTTAGDIAEQIGDEVEKQLLGTLEGLRQINIAVLIALVVVFLVVMLIVLTLTILVDALIVNPLCVGAERFMLKSVDGTGNVAELGYTFDHNYRNGVKTTFIRDLHIVLWMFLLFVPGIYKRYQYYMVDFILAENPDMPYKEVLARSKQMMDGQKWNTFVMDLSFILWHMLGALTCGLVEIFYTRPYLKLTRASLYRTLSQNEEEKGNGL